MKRILIGVLVLGMAGLQSACFLVSVPVKATGEIIEKSAHATGRAANRGIQRATTPDGVPSNDAYGADDFSTGGDTYDPYGYPE